MQIITPHQCRKARSLLNMSAYQLAERANIDIAIVVVMETDNSQLQINVREVQAVYDVLVKSGIWFVGTNRVRLLKHERR